MTVTLLCLFLLVGGITLCAVLAEPWQRPRYDRWARDARRRVDTFASDLTDEDAAIMRDLHREANGG